MREWGSHWPEPFQNKWALLIRLADIRATAPGSAALYIWHVRPNFENNSEDLLLVTRHEKKLIKLSSIVGNMVYSVSGKYIHPKWQIMETESSTHLSAEQQAFVTKNEKHTLQVTQIKYKKFRSRDVATKAKEALATIGKTSTLSLSHIGNSVSVHNSMTTNIKGGGVRGFELP